MCGRYAATAHPDELVEDYEVDLDATAEPSRSVLKNPQQPPPGAPDHNVAPSKQAPVVLTRAPRGAEDAAPLRQLRLLTWGLVPSWAKDPSVGARMTNARVESVLDKPAFARAAAGRRCLVPVTGWYEWQASPVATDAKGRPRKQPFFITRADDAPLALAGLYEFWKEPDAPAEDPLSWIVSYTILTTSAEPGLDRIHDRQPVALDPALWDDWLDPALTSPDEVRSLLDASHVPGRFRAWAVSTAVNSSRSNGPALLDPLPRDQLVGAVDPATGEVLGG
ncbi:SOS response-associated peptidase [Ornithinimicrobium humiphilum]|uniref:Abasic site processing protein n=1 Tax=Ornithinimicrobium humiphilum TaxID=125288 RepID=A0A543KQX6_9MICO|nr:SOS response-associated peptidase [Ornithinimicrobium humiphilum]TQM97479.1 putative SOS response-associated peptidase YedK [Ornithinimicrobium humiphilum]